MSIYTYVSTSSLSLFIAQNRYALDFLEVPLRKIFSFTATLIMVPLLSTQHKQTMTQKPVVLLSKPSLSQNIGSCARAMLNFGLTEMRLIDPQADWLNRDARSLSADADMILEQAKVFSTTQEALADLHYIYATTARPRDMIKDVVTPKELAPEVKTHLYEGKSVGILMGSEKAGLDNEDIAVCDKIVTIPLNPDFSSINLAQATILVCYELYQAMTTKEDMPTAWQKEDMPAPREELFGFFQHLEEELEKRHYYRCQDKKTIMDRNLRNMFSRAGFTSQEVRTLRGVISSLTSRYDQKNKN